MPKSEENRIKRAKNHYKRPEKVFPETLGAGCRRFESCHSDQIPDNGSRPVKYASKKALVQTIQEIFHPEKLEQDRKKPGKMLKFTPTEMVDPEELKARIRSTKEGDADEQT